MSLGFQITILCWRLPHSVAYALALSSWAMPSRTLLENLGYRTVALQGPKRLSCPSSFTQP